MEIDENHLKDISHHKQQELCTTRAAYRQGRNLTAVKVFTIASESQHLFVYGVPKINLRNELKSIFNKYGQILNIHVVSDIKVEMFTECFHVQYKRIQSARIAKRFVDNKSFYGGVLHVCYAPEYESLEETNIKLQQRDKDVLMRLHKYNQEDVQKGEEFIRKASSKKYQSLNERSGLTDNEIDTVSPIYNSDEPIIKKQKKGYDQNICYYKSQLHDINGGMIHDKKHISD